MRIYMKKTGSGQHRYSLTSSSALIDEGQSVTITLTAENVVDGTPIPYIITGISADDIVTGSLAGTMTVSSNTATLVIVVRADQLTEGPEALTFTTSGPGLTSTQQIIASVNIGINDTSLTPTYSLSSSVSPVDEGQSVTITVTTTDIFDNTLLPYTVTGISQADLSSGSLTGNVNIAGNTGTVTFTLASDVLTEGTETLTFTLDGPGTAISLFVNDTSTSFIPAGSTSYYNTGTFTFIPPEGVTSVSALCIGAGGGSFGFGSDSPGGGGGGLGWRNNIAVTPGMSYTVRVGDGAFAGNGQDSYFINSTVVKGGGGGYQSTPSNSYTPGGTYIGSGGGNGGQGGNSNGLYGGGGGGAGGYSGTGGRGGNGSVGPNTTGTSGIGGGGGGGSSGHGGHGGGGVGLNGQGTNGSAGVPGGAGFGGSGGNNGSTSYNHQGGAGGFYGGGAGGASDGARSNQQGAKGHVRIIWGTGKSFPSNV